MKRHGTRTNDAAGCGHSFATPVWQILVHAANRATQHRSELAAMLTIRGHSAGDLDMILYFRQQAAFVE